MGEVLKLTVHRFSRTEMLIGKEGLEKLKNSRVAVFGVGGVGSFTVEALARAGVGELVLVDFDSVDITNINRQIHALDTTVGRSKVELMAERVKLINPRIKVTPVKEMYTPQDGQKLLSDDIDYVVDAIDDVAGKLDLIKKCVEKGIPIVSSMGTGNKLDPTRFKVADISETSVCPLARVVRRGLKKAGIYQGVKVVYSTEKPIKAENGTGGSEKQVPASVSFVPASAGLILASVVIRDLIL